MGSPSAATRPERPCDGCQQRRSRCVIEEGAKTCLVCDFQRQRCTFAGVDASQSPPKRALENETDREPKRRLSLEAAAAVRPEGLANVSRQPESYAHHVGPSAEFEARLVDLLPFDADGRYVTSRGVLRRMSERETFIVSSIGADDRTYGDDATLRDQIEVVVAPHGPKLLDLFLKVVHPSYPVLDIASLKSYVTGSSTVPAALLGAVYTLSLGWWSYSPELASLNTIPDRSALERLTRQALDSALQHSAPPRLSTIQAGLLLAQCPDQDSWTRTAQLVALAQELGLHLDASEWAIPEPERGLRKRLAWALYMQDKWSALVHGRPSHLVSSSWAVQPLTEQDLEDVRVIETRTQAEGPEREQEDQRVRLLLVEMISLTQILADVLDTFYTPRALREIEDAGLDGTKMVLDRAKPIQITLKDWYTRLPAALRMDDVVSGRLSPQGYLHLAYFATEITLHRRIVESLAPGRTDDYLVHICRSAAKTRLISAMDFINRMRPEHLQSFWFFAAKVSFALIGTFGALLLATAPSREEAEFYRRRLSEYRWTLTVSSKRAPFVGFAVSMLDTAAECLRYVEDKPSISWPRDPPSPGLSLTKSDLHLSRSEFDREREQASADSIDSGLVSPISTPSDEDDEDND